MTDGINMKSEHRVYTHRRVYILSVYRSQSGGFRHTGETASILKAIWTPVSRGTRKRVPPKSFPRFRLSRHITAEHNLRSLYQRLIIQGRLIDYTNIHRMPLSTPFTVPRHRRRKNSGRAKKKKKTEWDNYAI